MEKSDIKILILEDDASLASAIDAGLSRAGYGTKKVQNYKDALGAFKLQDFHGVVADCMLPQKNGVDIVKELREENPNLAVVLTSGVFKDKAFARDAELRTSAKGFLFKPFNITDLVKIFDQEFAEALGGNADPLYQVFTKSQYSVQDRVNAIQKAGSLHGFDLPFVFSFLATPGIRGDLEVTYPDGSTSVVGFHDGTVDKVVHPDKESYFGTLLVENGFTSMEDVEAGLSLADNKPIGQRLVDASTLSPHAIEIVQHEQMVIRISKVIQNTSVDMKFTQQDRSAAAIRIEPMLFSEILGDWISTKLRPEWLKSFYTPWLTNPILQGPDFSKFELLKCHQILFPILNILKPDQWPYSLQELLSQDESIEVDLLKALHYLLLQRVLVFGPAASAGGDFEARKRRLEKIQASMEGQNHFEVLGLSVKARPAEIQRAYQELAKTLHPDRLPPETPKEIHDLSHKVFSIVTGAYQVLSNEKKRAGYIRTLESGLTEEILQAESAFENGVQLLQVGRYREARKMFERTLNMRGRRTDTPVYLAWALIKEKRTASPSLELAEQARYILAQVPHEDRHTPQYFFVKGLYYMLRGEFGRAKSALEHTLAVDPHFSEVRKEMALLRRFAKQQQSSSLTDELSQVVTKFFKKRSG